MIISVVNQKGGVAKTTTTHALGTALAMQGKKVLMVDLDSQASLSFSCGLRPHTLKENMYHVMCKKKPIKDIIYSTKLPNLFIAPSGIQLAGAELEIIGKVNRENILKLALNEVSETFDYIFIDCSPSLSTLVLNALSASDRIIIPCSPDYLAFQGLEMLSDTIENVRVQLNPGLKILGVILTMSDKRTLHTKEIREEIIRHYDVLGEVGISVKVKDAIHQGLSIVAAEPEHQISLDYKAIALSIGG